VYTTSSHAAAMASVWHTRSEQLSATQQLAFDVVRWYRRNGRGVA
jgi:hypothetical protein